MQKARPFWIALPNMSPLSNSTLHRYYTNYTKNTNKNVGRVPRFYCFYYRLILTPEKLNGRLMC
jgi:hypothetical protein